MIKADDRLIELINWARNVGGLPGEDVDALEKILGSVTVNRKRSGKRHKNARFSVDLFDNSEMKDWDLLALGLQNLNDHFQSIVGHYTDRNKGKTLSVGEHYASLMNFREDLIGQLFVEVMGKILTSPFVCYDDPGQSGVRQIKPVPDLSQAPKIVIDAVDELIEAMDKKNEAKGIETLAGEVMKDSTNKDSTNKDFMDQAHAAIDHDLKIAGAPDDEDLVDDSDVRCHRVEARRYPDPARPDDEDSGKDVILVTFFLKEDDVQKGAKVLIDDVWGSDPITLQAFVGNTPMFTGPTRHTLNKVAAIGTGVHWKGCRVRLHDLLSVTVRPQGDQNKDQVYYVTETKEFDPA